MRRLGGEGTSCPLLPLPPAIRPGLHCGGARHRPMRTAHHPSPGHQAGAPLRPHRSPSGHHGCGTSSPGHQAGAPLRHGVRPSLRDQSVTFPRPSGRGSIAACLPPDSVVRWPCASPGHQAGAPLRPGQRAQRRSHGHHLPPAIRPGLHCGEKRGHGRRPARPPRLPPAIRPGLHCGGPVAHFDRAKRYFPRPSGRGSIAATRPRRGAGGSGRLPPAIRPGLHCGRGCAVRLSYPFPLPPAIRPGLHCGPSSIRSMTPMSLTFPRPSGRGSIAATTVDNVVATLDETSPGHQAGAPLRHREPSLTAEPVAPSPGHQAGAPLRPQC